MFLPSNRCLNFNFLCISLQFYLVYTKRRISALFFSLQTKRSNSEVLSLITNAMLYIMKRFLYYKHNISRTRCVRSNYLYCLGLAAVHKFEKSSIGRIGTANLDWLFLEKRKETSLDGFHAVELLSSSFTQFK